MHTPVAHGSNHRDGGQSYSGHGQQYQQSHSQVPQYEQPYYQQQQFQSQSQQHQPYSQQPQSHQQGVYPTPSGYNDSSSQATPLQGLSYRVRGGIPQQQQQQQGQQSYGAPLSNSSNNSLASSGGWVMTAEEDAAAAEAALKAELKQAKVRTALPESDPVFVKIVLNFFFLYCLFAEKDEEAAEDGGMAAD
jgi:hypothetical protein